MTTKSLEMTHYVLDIKSREMTIRNKNNPNKACKVKFETKVSRKLYDAIMEPVIEFFTQEPNYEKKFFTFFIDYVTDYKGPEYSQKAKEIILEGFDLIDKFLENHRNIKNIQVPNSIKNDSKTIQEDGLKDLVYYSYKKKLFSFYDNTESMFVTPLVTSDRQEIIESMIKHIQRNDLGNTLFSIIRGKVQATKNRQHMWSYLSYSIRVNPSYFINELYNYTLNYTLLFMKDARNPMGVLGHFITNQINYLFKEKYDNELAYIDIEEKHLVEKSLLRKYTLKKLAEKMEETVRQFFPTEKIIKFKRSFKADKNVVQIISELINVIVFELPKQSMHQLYMNLPVFALYCAIILDKFDSSLNCKYLAKIITSIQQPIKPNKINKTRYVKDVKKLYSYSIPYISLWNNNSTLQSMLASMNSRIYLNLLTGEQFVFDPKKFIEEYTVFRLYLQKQGSHLKRLLSSSNYFIPKAK